MKAAQEDIGYQLEKAGWRQGSLVKTDDIKNISRLEEKGLILIVASQSCDIARTNNEPYVEFSVGRIISALNGNYTFNKNPRTLHTEILCLTSTPEIKEPCFVLLQAHEKILIPKENIIGTSPDDDSVFVSNQLDSYISWLVARYSRPALPTTFNELIEEYDPKDNRKKKAKRLDPLLSGIYVEIIPNAELKKGESYKVNILGLIAADIKPDIKSIEDSLTYYSDVMTKAGMDVTVSVKREDEISIAVFKRFKRFYYDDLSFRNNTPQPPETKIDL
jgi:hypothetical protein